ncbi:hypothetical protein ACFQH2_12610 [Natronoarchaeum sp. GCM10025703]|uniref:hypothetical protein n=1 Tax=Natronoarchaeum sp. GCM10025703 TaxID=3252685 RepID=UPI00361A3D28
MDRIATRADADVDRKMAVSDPRSSVETNDEGTRGVVTLPFVGRPSRRPTATS